MKGQKKETLSHFEDLAAKGEWESLYTKKSYNYVTRREEVIDMLSGIKYQSVVDLGCGTGHYADFFINSGKEYTGIDNSGEMVTSAGKRFPDVSFQLDDVESLSLLSEQFDLALAVGLVEYFSQPGKLVQEAYRVLKRGGYFLVQAPHKSIVWNINRVTFGLLTPLIAVRSYLRKRPVIYHAFHTESSLRALIEPAGFEHYMTRYCSYRLVPWPLSYGSYELERGISERITRAKSRCEYWRLAANIILLFRKT